MAFALILLAVGSVLAGYIGIPHAIGGHNALGAWLEPAFGVHAAGGGGEAVAEEAGLETTLMVFASVIAILGIAVATAIWLRKRQVADAAARTLSPVYNLLLNKYYVDELYDATIVQPIKIVSQQGLWRGFDVRVIDGAVNGTGALVSGGSAVLRRLQTGSVRAYAMSVFMGAVTIVGYYLWR